MNHLVLIENRRVSDRRQRTVAVKQERRWGDRRALAAAPIPSELLSQDATIVMLALLEGLADNVLSGDQWSQSIQHAYTLATEEYNIDPNVVNLVINRVMEVKERRMKDVTNG